MSTAVLMDVTTGPSLGQTRRNVVLGVISTPECAACPHAMAATASTTPPWGEAAGEEPTPAMTSSGPSSGQVINTKLLARPKTTSAAARRPPTLQYVYGSKCSIQVLGEKMYNPQPQPQPQPQLQPQPQERPKTSVQRIRGADSGHRPGTCKDRSGHLAIHSKELPLPICTAREPGVRAPNSASSASAAEKEILTITSSLRNRSAVGGRLMTGSSPRDRSAALLKELSMSFSLPSSLSKMGPTSPFKDCLRERWSAISKEGSLYSAVAASSRERLLPVRSLSCQDSSDDVLSTAPSLDDTQHCAGNKGHKTERSRVISYFKDMKETLNNNRSASPSKESGDDSSRNTPSSVKNSLARSRHAASVKRVRSSGSLMNVGHGGNSDTLLGNKTPKKDIVGKEMVLTSPRVITINRIPSAKVTESGKKSSRAESKLAADSATKNSLSKPSAVVLPTCPVAQTSGGGEAADLAATTSPTAAATASTPTTPAPLYQPSGGKDRLQQVQQWDDSPLQGEAPCNVTSFDMTISPVKECTSPRVRAASFLSDKSGKLSLSCVRPVSVREDAVLTLYSSLCGQPASALTEVGPDDSARINGNSQRTAEPTKGGADSNSPSVEEDPSAQQRQNAHILLQGAQCTAMPHATAETEGIITQIQRLSAEGTAAAKCVSKAEADTTAGLSPEVTSASKVNTAALQPSAQGDQTSFPVRRISQEEATALLKSKSLDGHAPSDQLLLVDERSYSVFHQDSAPLVSPRSAARGGGGGDRTYEQVELEDNEEINGYSATTDSSSSTPTVPFSGSDLLYGNGEGTGRGSQGGHGGIDEVAAGDVGGWDQQQQQRGAVGDKQKLKELDLQGNKRPVSRNSTSRKVPSYDKVAYDRDREELRPIANSLPPSKQSPLRANGIKNNLLRTDQFLTQRNNGSSGRDEDLVAMGTLWSPGQLQTRGSSTTTTTSSGKSTSAPNSGSYNATTAATGSVPLRRPINLSTSTSTRQLLHHSNATSTLNSGSGTMGNCVARAKEVEPKYSDPLAGATPTFQQRLMELAALEAETVRWERTKKVKKKPKQDRDS